MSSRAKVTIAVVVLFAAVVGLYYGFGGPRGSAPVPPDGALPAEADVGRAEADSGAVRAEDAASGSVEPAFALVDREPGGILSESVEQVIGRGELARGNEEPPSGMLSTDAFRLAEDSADLAADEPYNLAEPIDDLRALGSQGIVADDAGNRSTRVSRLDEAAPVTAQGPLAAAPPVRSRLSAPPRYVEYRVKPGDSMWTIAEEWLGDGRRWDLIATANPLVDPNRLRIGQKLRMPPKGTLQEPTRPRRARVGAGIGYTVQAGDTLTKIAKAYYSNPGKWRLIYDANRSTIGSDPDRLTVGVRLHIPPRTDPLRR